MLRSKSPLARYEGFLYSLLRIVAGAMFACHGMQKVLGWLTTAPRPRIASQSWVGGIIELAGGTLIALGLFTRWAAFIASGTMAVAYFQFHWKLVLDAWKWVPIVNRGELSALYCFLFLFIAARGPGPLSLDHHLRHV
jgi:putative oxidoreductase